MLGIVSIPTHILLDDLPLFFPADMSAEEIHFSLHENKKWQNRFSDAYASLILKNNQSRGHITDKNYPYLLEELESIREGEVPFILLVDPAWLDEEFPSESSETEHDLEIYAGFSFFESHPARACWAKRMLDHDSAEVRRLLLQQLEIEPRIGDTCARPYEFDDRGILVFNALRGKLTSPLGSYFARGVEIKHLEGGSDLWHLRMVMNQLLLVHQPFLDTLAPPYNPLPEVIYMMIHELRHSHSESMHSVIKEFIDTKLGDNRSDAVSRQRVYSSIERFLRSDYPNQDFGKLSRFYAEPFFITAQVSDRLSSRGEKNRKADLFVNHFHFPEPRLHIIEKGEKKIGTAIFIMTPDQYMNATVLDMDKIEEGSQPKFSSNSTGVKALDCVKIFSRSVYHLERADHNQ